MHYLRMYLDCKAYNTALGDLLPTSIANSLKLNVHILNKRNGQIEDRLIESIAFNCKTLYIFRNGDHFDGLRPSGTQQPVTNRHQKLSSPKIDARLFNNHRRETFQASGTVPSTAVARDGSKNNRRVTGAVTVLDVATTPVPGNNVKSYTPPQGVRVPEQMPGTTVTVNTPPMGVRVSRVGVVSPVTESHVHLMEDQQLPSVCPARVQPCGIGPVKRYARQELLNIKPAHLQRSTRKMLFSLQLWQPSGTKQMMTNEQSARSQTQTDFHSRESGNISNHTDCTELCFDHDMLLSRLNCKFGVTNMALCWFRSYLSDRYQTVLVHEAQSEKCELLSLRAQYWGPFCSICTHPPLQLSSTNINCNFRIMLMTLKFKCQLIHVQFVMQIRLSKIWNFV